MWKYRVALTFDRLLLSRGRGPLQYPSHPPLSGEMPRSCLPGTGSVGANGHHVGSESSTPYMPSYRNHFGSEEAFKVYYVLKHINKS